MNVNVVNKDAVPLSSYTASGFAKPTYDSRYSNVEFIPHYPIAGVKGIDTS